MIDADLAELHPSIDVPEDDVDDLGGCPYYGRYHGWGDPEGTCFQLGMCEHGLEQPEPWCVTMEPAEGWLSVVTAWQLVWWVTEGWTS